MALLLLKRLNTPLMLCKRWAEIIVEVVQVTHPCPITELPSHPDKRARAHAQKQTKKSLSFMPDWSHVATIDLPKAPPFTVGVKLPAEYQQDTLSIPKGARILRVDALKMGGVGQRDSIKTIVACGVPWSEEGFVSEALTRGHPCNLLEGLPKNLLNAIENNVNMKPEEVISKRASWLKKWTHRALELKEKEAKLHAGLRKHRKAILQGKRILVLREIVEEMNYPDPEVVGLILNGFDLVGSAGGGRVLPMDFQPATLTVEELGEHSKPSNQAIMRSTKSSGSDEVDQELWRKTMEEVDKGWLTELQQVPQDDGRISRRFAVVQSGKVRPIDNYSESQVNNAVNILSKCTVDGVDSIAAVCAHYMKASLEAKKPSTLLGRSFDLKSA